ncbi:hypothetical protein GA707_20340 [Nostocoides sp. F2B08]|uniref:hypothetical protein n=1 Tax=Nostocoides sp. F2B08 TaxID=2653936 RepID=UPI001263D3B8|nr:hypothetical protein [Tetrasphaera sp. F2B08]KAB7739556.1 hypothetical protein GA707_20340 [Tetrasphaera sp. F2B08]
MAFDVYAESLRLIESRHVEPVPRLSRRRRFAPMGVDVVGDVAVTMFARRGVGCSLSETYVLSRRDGHWRLLGGGSDAERNDLLADRPAWLPEEPAHGPGDHTGIDPSIVRLEGGGGVRDSGGRADWVHWSGRWISYVVLRVSAQVASLQTDGRQLVVPWHGRVVIASTKRRPSGVKVYDDRGQLLGEVLPQPSRS